MTKKTLVKKKSTKLYTKNLYHKEKNKAFLILEDESIIFGEGFGYPSYKVGEVCFNTSMTGHQEILTDPSYKSQIITFTFPHIGITGTNKIDIESIKSFASGLIIRERMYPSSNWRSNQNFGEWVEKMGLPGISGIDTRALTKKIINLNAPKGLICYDPENKFKIKDLKETLRNWKGLNNLDLVPSVTSKKTYFVKLPFYLRVFSSILLIFALARPQSSINWEESTIEGIDIVLAMDISASMLAEDLSPNRLESSKKS